MCYAIPGKIVELKEKIAVVDYFGEHRRVLNEFKDLACGDYVYAQGGILIQKIPEAEALDIVQYIAGLLVRYQLGTAGGNLFNS